MSDLALGLMAWFIVALLASMLIGLFMRDPRGEDGDSRNLPTSDQATRVKGFGRDDDDLAGPPTRF